MPMMSDSAWKVCQRNKGIWGEHRKYTRHEWKHEVLSDNSQRGYWDWVDAKIEMEEEDERGHKG